MFNLDVANQIQSLIIEMGQQYADKFRMISTYRDTVTSIYGHGC